MIIESGIDVIQVLVGSVSNDDPHGLWIIAMDDDLRLLFIEPLAAEISGGVEDHLDRLELFLDGEQSVRYFVLAWSTDIVRERESGWLSQLDDRLNAMPEFDGRRLLGQVVFDPQTMFASVPRCAFTLEPHFADLPRAMAIPGPHGLDCGCPPCRADRRAYDESYSYDPGPYDAGLFGTDIDDPYGAGGDTSDYGGPTFAGSVDPGMPYPMPPYPMPPYPTPPYPTPPYLGPGSRPHRARGQSAKRHGAIEPYPELFGFAEPTWNVFSKRWFPEPARARKRWTFDEEVAVAQSHFAGLSCFDISILMHRQPGAIAQRLRKLGISTRTVDRQPSLPGTLRSAGSPPQPAG